MVSSIELPTFRVLSHFILGGAWKRQWELHFSKFEWISSWHYRLSSKCKHSTGQQIMAHEGRKTAQCLAILISTCGRGHSGDGGYHGATARWHLNHFAQLACSPCPVLLQQPTGGREERIQAERDHNYPFHCGPAVRRVPLRLRDQFLGKHHTSGHVPECFVWG